MRPVALALAIICSMVVCAGPVLAQAGEHRRGEGAFSPDSAFIAFIQEGRPDSEVIVLAPASGDSFRLQLPEGYHEVRNIGWAPSANILLFASRDATGTLSEPHAIRGNHASAIWAVSFEEGAPAEARLLARGEDLRTPALSADGGKLAWFQPVPKPNEMPPKQILSPQAYAVFEKDLATGETRRVAYSQYARPQKLFYQGADAWLFNADEPAYLHVNGGVQFWSGNRPSAPPGKGTFNQLTNGIKALRMTRDEMLPDYPDFVKPWPAMEILPPKSQLTGVTADGRVILWGAPGPENTMANQMRNTASWYVDGVSRVPMRNGYFTMDADGQKEVYYVPQTPEGYGNLPGGEGVNAALTQYYAVRMQPYPTPDDFGLDTSRFFLFEGADLVMQRDVTDIVEQATLVTLEK